MGRRIKYTTTHFQRPTRIDQQTYLLLKSTLLNNPDFNIDKSPGSFKENYKKEFKFLKYSFVYFVFFIIILTNFYDGGHDKTIDPFRTFITIPAIIAGLGSFMIGIDLFLSGPSYANYLKDKRNYFESMKLSIIQSSDYADFCSSFYYSYER